MFEGIVSVQIVRNYGFIEFENYNSAMKALSLSLSKQLYVARGAGSKGRPIVVGWSKHSSGLSARAAHPPSADSQVLYVGNLAAAVTPQELEQIWSDVKVKELRRPEGRDYAFIQFSTPDDAMYAMQSIASRVVVLQERQVSFGWAKGKPAAQSNESQECWFCLASPLFKVSAIIQS
ncbi:hypothetical protein EON65_57605 [archaeon]|nr:MAG: hypothetical protein EON65_57605 [archaeon]